MPGVLGPDKLNGLSEEVGSRVVRLGENLEILGKRVIFWVKYPNLPKRSPFLHFFHLFYPDRIHWSISVLMADLI